MRVLQIVPTLDAAYGGPVYSAVAIRKAIGRIGHSSELLCLSPESSQSVTSDGVHFAGVSFGRYRFSSAAAKWLEANCMNYDFVVVHGIWQYQSLLARILARMGVKYYVFIHGALDPWFRQEYPLKHLKKAIYWNLVEARNLRMSSGALFTCEEERSLAKVDFSFDGIGTHVIPYGIEDPLSQPRGSVGSYVEKLLSSLDGKLVFLFLSRLHRKKGLLHLISAFSDVIRARKDVHLVIAGPDEDGSGEEVDREVGRLGLSGFVTRTGMVLGGDKRALFERADLFCLSSFSENFGLVVAEALAYSVPVLISNKVNIWCEVKNSKAGIVVDPDRNSTMDGMNAWLKLTSEEREALRVHARRCFEMNFEVEGTARTLCGLSQPGGVLN